MIIRVLPSLFALCFGLAASSAWANSWCVERPASGSITTYGQAHFTDSGGDTAAATSKEAKIVRGGQTATFATVADGSFVQWTDRAGSYWVPITIASTDTLGQYVVSYRGTVESNARDGGDDLFVLVAIGQCGTYLDASVSTRVQVVKVKVGTGSTTTVVTLQAASGVYSEITADNQYVVQPPYILNCGTFGSREIVATDDNTTDTITISAGHAFGSSPTNNTECIIEH